MYHRQMVTGQPVTATRHLLTKGPVNPTQSYLYQKPRLFQVLYDISYKER